MLADAACYMPHATPHRTRHYCHYCHMPHRHTPHAITPSPRHAACYIATCHTATCRYATCVTCHMPHADTCYDRHMPRYMPRYDATCHATCQLMRHMYINAIAVTCHYATLPHAATCRHMPHCHAASPHAATLPPLRYVIMPHADIAAMHMLACHYVIDRPHATLPYVT
jgi:hypothetical protein